MNRLRKLRKQKFLSQYDIQKRTKIPQSQVSLIENDYLQPSREIKRKIARVLGCRINDVFPAEDAKNERRW